MPSTSKKQHNFMAALAHNPAFAKKVGIPQSVGKDFNEADKGRKFGRGGTTQQRINKQDTKHGKLDLPVANLNRMAGMKGGGSVRKFKEGGVSEDTRAATRETVANRRQAADERDAVVEAKRLGLENARKDATSSRAYNQASRDYQREMFLNPHGTVSGSLSKFTDKVGDKMRGVGKLLGSNRVTSMDDTAQMQAREDVKGYKKGGFMKKSKMDMGGMAGMKKGGMPMKDGKPAFMKKFAKGGGIESRGKTKGTMIRMATGGSVSSASRRADGIAQRGKTKLTNY